jgi:hypothetical protein
VREVHAHEWPCRESSLPSGIELYNSIADSCTRGISCEPLLDDATPNSPEPISSLFLSILQQQQQQKQQQQHRHRQR